MKKKWCERGDLNPHPFRDRILNPARLPVPPLSHVAARFGSPSSGSCHVLFLHVWMLHRRLHSREHDARGGDIAGGGALIGAACGRAIVRCLGRMQRKDHKDAVGQVTVPQAVQARLEATDAAKSPKKAIDFFGNTILILIFKQC